MSRQTERFRLNPRHVFELSGRLTNSRDGFTASIWLRYRPDEPLTWVASELTSPSQVVETMRELAEYALSWAPPLHWLDTRHHETPEVVQSMPATMPGAFATMLKLAENKAKETGIAWYLWRDGSALSVGNNPPALAPFCSVTALGDRSAHDGRRTWPLDRVPDEQVLDALVNHRLKRVVTDFEVSKVQSAVEALTAPERRPRSTSLAPSRRSP
jgi:hypothetical protein